MNDKWVEFAIRIQSIAQAGLQYGKDKYDRERYEELRQIAAEMLSLKTDIPVNKIFDLFCHAHAFVLSDDTLRFMPGGTGAPEIQPVFYKHSRIFAVQPVQIISSERT